jgi:hypothetical protein
MLDTMREASSPVADVLRSDARPLFFPVEAQPRKHLEPPAHDSGVAVRTWVRSLSGMQKEVIVLNVATDASVEAGER